MGRFDALFADTPARIATPSSGGERFGNLFTGTPTPQPKAKIGPTRPPTPRVIIKPEKPKSSKSIFSGIQKAVRFVLKIKSKVSPERRLQVPLGRLLQKAPDVDLGTKGQKFFKASDTETKIVNFLSNFPTMIARSYGQTLEQLGTKEGKERARKDAVNLPKTMSEIKSAIDDRDWQRALETATNNSALMIGLDVADFIPLTFLAKFGFRGVTTSLKSRKIAQTIVQEAIEPKIVKPKPKVITPKVVEKPKVVKVEPKVAKPVVKKAVIEDPLNFTSAQKFVRAKTPKGFKFFSTETRNTISIDSIESLVKGKGIGTKAIKDLFNYADAKNKTIQVFPANERLAKWYDSLGFGDIEMTEDGLYMLRKPKVVKVEPKVTKVISVPVKPKAPVKPTAKVPSKIALSIEAKAIERKLTKGFEGLAGFDRITIKDQARRVADLINLDIKKARRIIRREEALPSGMRGISLITGMEERILKTTDRKLAGELTHELANSPLVSETSEAAQILRLAAERVPDSLTKQLQDVKRAKEDGFKRRTGKSISEATKSTRNQIKKEINKKTPKREDWGAFLKEIQC